MVTNTYAPQVGGVARSVERFTAAYHARGHKVLVIAPFYDKMERCEPGVVRVPAIQHFNGSDFSVILPAPMFLTRSVNQFQPDLFHSHHPFLLGDTALRMASMRQTPIVFTYHTMYELYIHYVPLGAESLAEMVKRLSAGYANLCNHVIAPSRFIARLISARGVSTPTTVIPTGVDTAKYKRGDGRAFRRRLGIPQHAFVAGHVGRLAPEKNLNFLARAAGILLRRRRSAHFVVVGSGPSLAEIEAHVEQAGVADRCHFTGELDEETVIKAYHAMDVFAFTSQSETQGIVLAEAMAAGLPVVALDAPAVSEMIEDGKNGLLIKRLEPGAFAEALIWASRLNREHRAALSEAARNTAECFSVDACAEKSLAVYEQTLSGAKCDISQKMHEWTGLLKRLGEEWSLWANRFSALTGFPARPADKGEVL